MQTTYYQASIKRGAFEADTLPALIGKIVAYYADGETREAPEVDYITLFTKDTEIELTPIEVAAFNRELESDFEDEVLQGDYHEAYVRSNSYTGRSM